mmetsp:Transcript_13454/g.34492  ORF Transcript_13454/g.34492 Transcript_13454/m.34492 type:complete len:205 (-) Transcript_13454:1722-2336(-)
MKVYCDFCRLAPFIVHLPYSLDKINPGIVFAFDEGAFRNVKVELSEGRLGKQAPQNRVRVVLNEGCNVFSLHGRVKCRVDQSTRVPKRLDLNVDNMLLGGMLGVLEHIIEEDRANSQVFETADPACRVPRLFGIGAAEDVHAGALHDGEQLWVVFSPPHIPNILAFEAHDRRPGLSATGFRIGGLGSQIIHYHDAAQVHDGHLC